MNLRRETVKLGTRLRDRAERSEREEDGRAIGQPQGLVSKAYLNSTPQDAGSEEARKGGHIFVRSS